MTGHNVRISKYSDGIPGEWTLIAACREIDPDIFFPRIRDKRAKKIAVSICNSCPVVSECLRHALQVQSESVFGLQGIWGGTNELDRKRMLSKANPIL